MKLIDLTGRRFGKLMVLSRGADYVSPGNGARRAQWLCLCDCGRESLAEGQNLKRGNTTTCGCSHGEKHGLGHLPEYSVWCDIHKRCGNPKHKSYHNYGGRGLKVADEWLTFSRFYADMGPRPSDAHTLERVDNEKGYGPGNCVWATRQVQGNNRRGNLLITAFGKTQTLMQWSRETGIGNSTIRHRIVVTNWPVEKALTEKVRGA